MKNFSKFLMICALFYCSITTIAFTETLGDINFDNKINLSEAIYALQVSSNIKSIITIPNTIVGDTSKKLSGLISITINTNEVVGGETLFTEELMTGDIVKINNEKFTVETIVDDTHLFIDTPHITGAMNSPIYTDDNLLSVQNGTGLNKLYLNKSGIMHIGDKDKSSNKTLLRVFGNIKIGNNIAPEIFLQEYDEDMFWSITCDGKSFQIRDKKVETPDYVRFSINSYGHVGIGTAYPKGRLDVNGEIYQRGILHSSKSLKAGNKIESIEEHAEDMFLTGKLKAMPNIQKDKNGQNIIEYGAQLRGIIEELEKAHIFIHQLNETIKKQQKTITELSEKMYTIQLQSKN